MVELARGRAVGSAAVRSQPKPAPAASKAKGPKHKAQGSLTAISEAAEWAEESTRAGNDSAEVDALWAEAGLAGVDAKPQQGASSALGSAVSAALAKASAARKGGLGIFPATAGSVEHRGWLKASRRSPRVPRWDTAKAVPTVVAQEKKVAEESDSANGSSTETSDEELETQHVSIAPRRVSAATDEVLDLHMDDEVSSTSQQRLKSVASASPTVKEVTKSTSPPKSRLQCHTRDVMDHAIKSHICSSAEESVLGSTLKTALPVLAGDAKLAKAPPSTPEVQSGEEVKLEEEWAEIGRKSEELAKQARESKGKVVLQQDVLGQPVSYKEVHDWLQDSDAGGSAEQGSSQQSGIEKMEKEFVLHLKATPFDFLNVMHHRMLRTMYCKLARCKVCPRVGSHWEVLGFQGSDPLTDLNRSGGLLNVIHMFFFFAHYFDIFKAAYHLSQDVEQNFPLAAVCINITKMVMDALLAGQLANLEGSVFQASSLAFCGGFHHFYSQWKTQKRSIRDTELTFKEIKSQLRSQPRELLHSLEEAVSIRKQGEVETIEFTDLAATADEST